MSSFRSNDIYKAYKIFKVHENDLLIAEDKFLNHIHNLFQYAKEEEKEQNYIIKEMLVN
ncbi:17774_t:CDS:2 [Gigaspora margarita]|uniref:17774_t:CDS:1 n=1 Tax=Gigaspora margarita TaxID=4874 RepID=A0ABM8W0X4_GIGMA|nr:17774_t:CDS:2 [Gigaspora margarita]